MTNGTTYLVDSDVFITAKNLPAASWSASAFESDR